MLVMTSVIVDYMFNKKLELIFTRRVKACSSCCSQTVSLLPAISLQFILRVWLQLKIMKINKKTPYFESSGSFKVVDVDTTGTLITGACCDRQHAHAHLQLFSLKTGQQR